MQACREYALVMLQTLLLRQYARAHTECPLTEMDSCCPVCDSSATIAAILSTFECLDALCLSHWTELERLTTVLWDKDAIFSRNISISERFNYCNKQIFDQVSAEVETLRFNRHPVRWSSSQIEGNNVRRKNIKVAESELISTKGGARSVTTLKMMHTEVLVVNLSKSKNWVHGKRVQQRCLLTSQIHSLPILNSLNPKLMQPWRPCRLGTWQKRRDTGAGKNCGRCRATCTDGSRATRPSRRSGSRRRNHWSIQDTPAFPRTPGRARTRRTSTPTHRFGAFQLLSLLRW